MLVLTIKEGQKVRIGDGVSVFFRHSYNVEKRSSKAVKLGVEAPQTLMSFGKNSITVVLVESK